MWNVTMRKYSIRYKPPGAVVDDPVLSITISAAYGSDIWTKAHALGFVYSINDLSTGGSTVFSKNWNFNFIGVDQEIVKKDQYKD